MTAVAEVSAETPVLRIDPAALVENPLNPRRHVVVSDGFVATIRASGVLKPVHVFERDRSDGQLGRELVLLDGHRRTKGALATKGAPLARTVPMIVAFDHEPSPAEQLLFMLKCAVKQADLSPIEQGRGYVRLIDEEGLKQSDICAETGMSPTHVSRHVAIVQKLPPKALAEFDNGNLTVTAEYGLTHIADNADLVEKLATNRRLSDADIESAVRAEMQKRDWATAEASARAACTKAGAYVVDKASVANGTVVVLCGHGDVEVTPSDADGLPADSAVFMAMPLQAHDGEGCAAVAVNYKGDVINVCTSPDSHPDVATLRRMMIPAPTPAEINEIVARNNAAAEAARTAPSPVVDDGRPSWSKARDRAVFRRTHLRSAGPCTAGAALVNALLVSAYLDRDTDVAGGPSDHSLDAVVAALVADDEPRAALDGMPSARAAQVIAVAVVEWHLFADPAGPDDAEGDVWEFETVPWSLANAWHEFVVFSGLDITDVEQHWLDACDEADESIDA